MKTKEKKEVKKEEKDEVSKENTKAIKTKKKMAIVDKKDNYEKTPSKDLKKKRTTSSGFMPR
ncbi:MAG: hypothetical protein V4481_05070 [Patescibacteria group bacterium]